MFMLVAAKKFNIVFYFCSDVASLKISLILHGTDYE